MSLLALRRYLKRIRADKRGLAVTEFAILAPTFFLMLMAFYDVAHTMWAKSVIDGALQKAARDNGLNTTSNTQSQIDGRVSELIRMTDTDATVTFSRRYYKSYTAAHLAEHEPFTDSQRTVAPNTWALDGICNHGEPYTDRNWNGTYDADGADAGQGGAQDDVIYTVTVSYPRLFPLHNFLGWSQTVSTSAATILENQPWATQSKYSTVNVPILNCPL
jgi:Flp pilus assembly protein TadG